MARTTTEWMATQIRTAALRDSELIDKTTRIPVEMRVAPETVEVAAAGARMLTLEIEDAGIIASGLMAARIDWEVSADNGVTWQPDGYGLFSRGSSPGKHTKHFLEVRSVGDNPWPAGTKYRFHWRQRDAGLIGMTLHVDR